MEGSEILLNKAFFACKTLLSRLDRKLILLLSLPLLLIALNDQWLFLENGYKTDPWVYFGYFLDLKQHLNTFANTYYGVRLPWILPGWLVYHFFSPLVAAYVLHLTFYYAAIISLYLILKHTTSPRAALLTATLMGYYGFFLKPIGSNYIDGAGLTYFLLTLLMLTYGMKHPSSRLWPVLAGIFCACLIHTQLFLIIYIPLIILYYIFINYERLFLFPFHLKFFRSGFIGLTLLLCIVNYCLNGRIFFFAPSLIICGSLISKSINPWWTPISSWWMNASWLLLPVLTFFTAGVILIFRRITQTAYNRRFLLFFQIYFILNLLLFIALEVGAKQPVLQCSEYTSYLLPAMFLAVGSQLALVSDKLSSEQFYGVWGAIVIMSLLPFVTFIDFHWITMLYSYRALLTILFTITGLICITIQRNYCRILAVLLISASIVTVTLFGVTSQKDYLNASFNKHVFFSAVKSLRAIQDLDPQGKTRFWYNNNTPFGYTFRSVASTYLWGYRLINETFPDVKSQPYQPLVPNEHVCILSDEPDALEKAYQNLAQVGLKGELIDERTIQQGPINYKITFLKTQALEK